MNIVDVIYLFFSVVVLYFSFLFLLIWSRNRSRLDYVPRTTRLPSVSLIIPAHNEARSIVSTIKNLQALDYPKRLVDITVVNDGSSDETVALARTAGVRVISQRKSGKAAALNNGIRHARGEIVACVDADSHPERNALLKSVPFFNDEKVAAVTTHILVKNPKGILQRLQAVEYAMIAWTRKLSEYVDSIYATPGPLSLYRRSVINSVGGFDTKNATEDIEIAWRLLDKGYKIKMSPANTWTRAPERWRRWIRQRVRWNVGGIQTSNKYRSSLFKRGSGVFGFYVLPFFTLSYAFSMAALSLFAYLIYIWIYSNVTFMVAAFNAGLNPFVMQFWPILDVLMIFGLIIFAISATTMYLGMRGRVEGTFRNTVYTAIYMTVYITIFPFLLAYSLIKYAQGYREW